MALMAVHSITAYPQAAPNEARTVGYFESIRNDPNELMAFLREMPKGGDLHNHLVGAIYAESFIEWAAEKGLCTSTLPPSISVNHHVGVLKRTVPARNALADRFLYRDMVDAYSMRKWELSGLSGHDHFFDTFDKFILATYGNTGRMLAETAARAASQREVYQELMHAPAFPETLALANRSGWDDALARQRKKLFGQWHGSGGGCRSQRKWTKQRPFAIPRFIAPPLCLTLDARSYNAICTWLCVECQRRSVFTQMVLWASS